MANGNTPSPGTRKVTVGALSGAVATIVVFAIEFFGGKPLPPEVAAATATVATAVLVYMTKETFT